MRLDTQHGGASVELLEDAQPEPPLWPRDTFLRARAGEIAAMVQSGTQPLQNNYVLGRVSEGGGDETAWARQAVQQATSQQARGHRSPLLGLPPTRGEDAAAPGRWRAARSAHGVSQRISSLLQSACAGGRDKRDGCRDLRDDRVFALEERTDGRAGGDHAHWGDWRIHTELWSGSCLGTILGTRWDQ